MSLSDRSPLDRAAWVLVRDGHEAAAVLREIPELGWDARLSHDGALRQSQVFRDVQQALTRVADWRTRLKAEGWVYVGREGTGRQREASSPS